MSTRSSRGNPKFKLKVWLVVAAAAVIAALILFGIARFANGGSAASADVSQVTAERAQNLVATSTSQYFSPDTLKAKLSDYSKLASPKSLVNIGQIRDRVKLIFSQPTAEGVDLAMADFLYDNSISRGDKIAALVDFIKSSVGQQDAVMYTLDIISALKPLEFSRDLIQIFEATESSVVKARVISTLGQGMTFSPEGAVSASDANELNMNISRIQSFLQNNVFSSDAAVQLAAVSEYVKIAPQSESIQTIQSLLRSGVLSQELKYGVVIDTAISEKTSVQSVIIDELIRDATKEKSSALLQSKIVGMLQAPDSGNMFTQESKYILQEFLKTREPSSLDAKSPDILINAAEFNAWLTAYSSASSTSSISAAQWTVDYIRTSGDNLKQAYAIALSSDDVIKIISSDAVLAGQIKSKMQLSVDSSATDQEKQMFVSAIARLPPRK